MFKDILSLLDSTEYPKAVGMVWLNVWNQFSFCFSINLCSSCFYVKCLPVEAFNVLFLSYIVDMVILGIKVLDFITDTLKLRHLRDIVEHKKFMVRYSPEEESYIIIFLLGWEEFLSGWGNFTGIDNIVYYRRTIFKIVLIEFEKWLFAVY